MVQVKFFRAENMKLIWEKVNFWLAEYKHYKIINIDHSVVQDVNFPLGKNLIYSVMIVYEVN